MTDVPPTDPPGFAAPGDAGTPHTPPASPPTWRTIEPSAPPPVAPAPQPPPAAPPVMPPLGPPYGPPPASLPPPRFPVTPPEQWPAVSTWVDPNAPSASPVPPSTTFQPAVIAGIVAFVVVLLGAFAYSQTGGDSNALQPLRTTTTTVPSSSDPGTTTPRSTTTTTQPAQLDAVIADIKAFVEKERGLKFTADVPVQLADDQEFERQLLAQFDEEQPQLEELGQVLEPLGLVPAGTDVVQEERTLLTAGVVGFFDPETKKLVVRGTDTSPFTRRVLAHELTHALDDQHFDLNRKQLDTADDETGFGFSALVEGNARRVEDAYMATMSVSDQMLEAKQELDLLARHPEMLSVPPILLDLVQAAYDDGELFVEKVLAAGGQARLDAAFGAPPTTSEQVLEPQKFLDGEGAVVVAPPVPDGAAPVANRGVLGALLLQKLLEAGGGDASATVALWGGDQYVTWTDGARTCVKDAMVGDDAPATAHLGEALAAWARSSGATVEQDPSGALLITACTS